MSKQEYRECKQVPNICKGLYQVKREREHLCHFLVPALFVAWLPFLALCNGTSFNEKTNKQDIPFT